MSQPSLVPAPSPHQEHAVRVELTMTGFADRRLNQLGYACPTFGASCGNRTRASAMARRRHSTRPTKPRTSQASAKYRGRESNSQALVSKTSRFTCFLHPGINQRPRQDSNPRSPDSKSDALVPSELLGHIRGRRGTRTRNGMATAASLRTRLLVQPDAFQWRRGQESNLHGCYPDWLATSCLSRSATSPLAETIGFEPTQD
jgi:hypothetical protein